MPQILIFKHMVLFQIVLEVHFMCTFLISQLVLFLIMKISK